MVLRLRPRPDQEQLNLTLRAPFPELEHQRARLPRDTAQDRVVPSPPVLYVFRRVGVLELPSVVLVEMERLEVGEDVEEGQEVRDEVVGLVKVREVRVVGKCGRRMVMSPSTEGAVSP